MSDTPRTDAFYGNLYDPKVPKEMIEMASGKERDFCRQLERELREANWQVEKYAAEAKSAIDAYDRIIKEIDKALNELQPTNNQ